MREACFEGGEVFAFFTGAEFVDAGFVVLDGDGFWLDDDAGDVAGPGDFPGFFIVEIDLEARSVEELKAESDDAVIEGVIMTGRDAVVGPLSLHDDEGVVLARVS